MEKKFKKVMNWSPKMNDLFLLKSYKFIYINIFF